ncbi:unnamed protein product [[Candida] boidinii]|nr:unnamed protein product [[Candida] boidinii]
MTLKTSPVYKRVHVPVDLSPDSLNFDPNVAPTDYREIHYYKPEEEIAYGPACWLWDYVRRCKGSGYFVPLSGGIDSCATSVIIHSMCRLVVEACKNGNEQVIKDARLVANKTQDEDWIPSTPQEFSNLIFHTCYMGTKNSSIETRQRAKDLAEKIGSYHVDLNMDSIVASVVSLFEVVTD